MNIFGTPKKRKAEVVDVEHEAQDEAVPIARTQSWSAGSQMGSKALLGLLVLAIAAGPIGGFYAYRAGQQSQEAVAALARDWDEDQPAPELFVAAERAGREAVEAWLSATRDDHVWLDEVLPGQAGERLPITATDYDSVMAVEVLPGDDLWSVTIAATLEEPAAPVAETETPTGEAAAPTPAPTAATVARRYFQVAVLVDREETRAVAVTLPAAVGAPTTAQAPRLPYRHSIALTDEIPTTITAFLEALLTGAGEIERYVTPGAVVDRLATPAYLGVSLREVLADVTPGDLSDPEEGATVRVLVSAELTRFDGTTVPTTYVLDLTSRSGRWEITAITTPATTTEGDS